MGAARGEGRQLHVSANKQTGHRRTNGVLVRAAFPSTCRLYLEAEYGFTKRFSVTAGSHMYSRSTPILIRRAAHSRLPEDQLPLLAIRLQDLGFTARYNWLVAHLAISR